MTHKLIFDESEIILTYVRSSGPGGQNVNKVATAVQLRFNIKHSMSLPEKIRERLLHMLANKITSQGDLIIKADRFRTQERNKKDALERLLVLIEKAAVPIKKRKKTKPTLASKKRWLQKKQLRSKTKALRTSRTDDGS